ncbi:MAG: hypothetical protein Kow0059_09940 [Candidatus Sumerlaeia bacterium]
MAAFHSEERVQMFFDFTRIRPWRSRRESSWDRTGRNLDFRRIRPGQSLTLCDIQGAGLITHLWMTVNHLDYYYPRRLILQAFWDECDEASINAPLGDFFGVGHGRTSHYTALLTNQIGDPDLIPNNTAFNSFFPMPFRRRARLTVTNTSPLETISFYYYVDYVIVDDPEALDGRGYFHCRYNDNRGRSGPCETARLDFSGIEPPNLSGDDNYVILDTEGCGHYVGCALSIDNWNGSPPTYWFGEGDDMIFIDGEPFPPSLHGTGTEDYFCAAWGFPAGRQAAPFHGVSFKDSSTDHYDGQWTMFRHHVADPIYFSRSIRVTIEQGHGNISQADYSSAAYYYLDRPRAAGSPSNGTRSEYLPALRHPLQKTAYERMLFVLERFQQHLSRLEAEKTDFHPFLDPSPDLHELNGQMRRAFHEKRWHDCMQAGDRMLRALERR